MSLSNKEIEDQAIETVIAFEHSKRRKAQDVRRQNLGYDVKSTNRKIEVKGIEKTLSQSGNWRFIQQRSVQLLLQDNTFYIYIVDNVGQGSTNAGVYILSRKEALPFLRIKHQASYTLQIPADKRELFKKK